jgi:hypothetical protein
VTSDHSLASHTPKPQLLITCLVLELWPGSTLPHHYSQQKSKLGLTDCQPIMIDTHTLLYATLPLSGLVLLRHYLARPETRHPPSPRSFPLIGNLLSIPSGMDQIAYMKLGQQLNSE